MDHIQPIPSHQTHYLTTAAKVAPVLAIVCSAALWLVTNINQVSNTNRQTSDNTTAIETIKTQQVQLNLQLTSMSDQLRQLKDQNRDTQQELHDLGTNFQSFENRFIVVPDQYNQRSTR